MVSRRDKRCEISGHRSLIMGNENTPFRRGSFQHRLIIEVIKLSRPCGLEVDGRLFAKRRRNDELVQVVVRPDT